MREYPDSPAVGVGVVVLNGPRVLLIRRANEPGRGQWSIPGGSVELGETLQEAARREVGEECGVDVIIGSHIDLYDLIDRDDQGRVRFHYVLVHFVAQYQKGQPRAGTDALEVAWASAQEVRSLTMPERLREVVLKALTRSAQAP